VIRFDDFKIIPPHRFARLMASIGEDPYRIVRPAIVEDVPGVRAWLRQHPDGGWIQADDETRMAAARRLLFVSWLRVRGALSDG
jgi:hypothetical protein